MNEIKFFLKKQIKELIKAEKYGVKTLSKT